MEENQEKEAQAYGVKIGKVRSVTLDEGSIRLIGIGLVIGLIIGYLIHS